MPESNPAATIMAKLGFKDRDLPPLVKEIKSTPVHLRPKNRIVPMKIICLGLPRTGTTSLREALYSLGYADVHHMRSTMEGTPGEAERFKEGIEAKYTGKGRPLDRAAFDQLLGYCEAACDYPASIFVEELVATYPDAKFILTLRDSPAAWHKSVLESVWTAEYSQWHRQPGLVTWLMKRLYAISPAEQMRLAMFEIIWGGQAWFPQHGQRVYDDHNELVRRTVPSERLLEFNAKQGWGPLCEFLELQTPEGDFPRVNEGAVMKGLIEHMQVAAQEQRRRVTFWVQVVSAVGVAAGAALYFSRYHAS